MSVSETNTDKIRHVVVSHIDDLINHTIRLLGKYYSARNPHRCGSMENITDSFYYLKDRVYEMFGDLERSLFGSPDEFEAEKEAQKKLREKK